LKIGVFTVGEVDVRLLYRLVCCLEERFLYKFSVESSVNAPSSAFNAVKKQYFAPALMNKLKLAFPADMKYAMALTCLDLYGASLNYVFGDANTADRIAIISYHRLRPEFYGHDPENSLLFERLLKESMHQLAHILGSKHCYNRNCVMYYSSNIYDIDKKSSLFCPDCERKLKKAAAYDRSNDFHS
jgi:archaemetzincin